MGCYDTIILECPKCQREHEAQSKSGDCALDTFKLSEAPADVLDDVNRHAPFECECGCKFYVKVEFTQKKCSECGTLKVTASNTSLVELKEDEDWFDLMGDAVTYTNPDTQ